MIDRREAVKRISALLGGTLSASTLAGVLGGCQAPGGSAGVQALTASRKELLDVLTERIIPETDTPGARAARVTEFIDAMLTDFFPADERARFLEGLAAIDDRAEESFGKPFLGLDETDQYALLTQLDEAAFPDLETMSEAEREAFNQNRSQERPFFATLKELTISGYYTSEVGATMELRVNPMGEHRGDIPFAEAGRAWA
jgi:hypothetical protein